MAEHAATVGLDVIASILAEYGKRIVDKALRGEKLSDWEVGFLLMEATRMTLVARMEAIERRMDLIEKRMDMLEKRIEALEKRVEGLEIDVKQMRASIDSLRDLIINRLIDIISKKQ
ncbi:MAG: hypothetical protein QXQ57_05420 [Sulfolobales archaeon]